MESMENSQILNIYYADTDLFSDLYGVMPTQNDIEGQSWQQLKVNSDTGNAKVNNDPLEQPQFGEKIRPARTQKGFDRPVFEFERILTPGMITTHLELFKAAFGEYSAKSSDIQLTEITDRTHIKIGASQSVGNVIAIKSDSKLQFNIVKEITGASAPYTVTLAYPITVDTIATNHVIYNPANFVIDKLGTNKKFHFLIQTKDRFYFASHCSVVFKLSIESNALIKFNISIVPYQIVNVTNMSLSLTTLSENAGMGVKSNFSFITIGQTITAELTPDFSIHNLTIGYERQQKLNESNATEQGIIGVDDTQYTLTLNCKTFDTEKFETYHNNNTSFDFKAVRADGGIIINWGSCYVKKIEPLGVTDGKMSGEIEINPVVDESTNPIIYFGLV